jgi:hypothetical protein
MAAAETDRSWWHTLPGILTAIAGMITAITGLVVVLQRSGRFQSTPETAVDTSAETRPRAGRTAPTRPPRESAVSSQQAKTRATTQEPGARKAAPGAQKAAPAPQRAAPAPQRAAPEKAASETERAAGADKTAPQADGTPPAAEKAAPEATGTTTPSPDKAAPVGEKAAPESAASEQTPAGAAAGSAAGEAQKAAPAAARSVDELAGTWSGSAVDSAGQKVSASAEVKGDASFSLQSDLTGEQSGTLEAKGERLVFKTSQGDAGSVTPGKDAQGNDVLTWRGLAPAPAAEPGAEGPKGPVSLELEREQ